MTVQRVIRPAGGHGVVSTASPQGMREVRASGVGGATGQLLVLDPVDDHCEEA